MPSSEIVIERLTEISDESAQALTRLTTQLSASSAPGVAELRQVVANPNTYLFCARDQQGTIVAMLSLATFAIPTGMRAWIEDVVVDENVRGGGIASALVAAAFATAKEIGARTVDLTSRPSRVAANRLYERLGFERRETNVWRYEDK